MKKISLALLKINFLFTFSIMSAPWESSYRNPIDFELVKEFRIKLKDSFRDIGRYQKVYSLGKGGCSLFIINPQESKIYREDLDLYFDSWDMSYENGELRIDLQDLKPPKKQLIIHCESAHFFVNGSTADLAIRLGHHTTLEQKRFFYWSSYAKNFVKNKNLARKYKAQFNRRQSALKFGTCQILNDAEGGLDDRRTHSKNNTQ